MINFTIQLTGGTGDIAETDDDNIDVRIVLSDGRVFAATFFTIRNLSSLLKRYRTSGECANGRYVWAKDMIVVESISKESLQESIADLIATGEIESACTRIA